MNKSDACREVDMITLMSALWRRAWIIALISVVLGSIYFAWARFLITPTYEASALMYVNNTQDPGKPISNSELSAAQSLVDTYMVILSSRTTLDQIRSAAKLTYTDKRSTELKFSRSLLPAPIRRRPGILPTRSLGCFRPALPT